MTTKLFILLLTLTIISCGPRSGTKNQFDNITSDSVVKNLNQSKYVENVYNVGHQIFKKNCAVCHCSPMSNCEPGGNPSLINIFIRLPKDSLPYYESIVRNSLDIKTLPYAEHHFNKSLSDSLIKTVVEYIWLTSKPENRN